MRRAIRLGGAIWATIGLLISSAAAQTKPATLGLKAVKINHEQLAPSSDAIVAGPGDEITAHVVLKGWSPGGEKLRAFQATLSHEGFTSGTSGSIKPVNYDPALEKEVENGTNAFIDINQPQFVFHGLQTVAIVDTLSFDYRWLGVAVDNDLSILCPDAEKDFYGGTVKLKVSDDARGTFTIGFVEADWATVMNDDKNVSIIPMTYGSLRITIPDDGAIPPRIAGSEPPFAAILAYQPPAGFRPSFDLYFNVDVSGLSPADLQIDDGSTDPPRIVGVVPAAKTVTITLDRPLRPAAWTTIRHTPSGTITRVGSLPGDVDGDGALSAADLTALLSAAGAPAADLLAQYQTDINADGAFDLRDVLRLVEVLNGPKVYRTSLR